MTRSVALTIAGSDSSGGAGIQADLKTFQALGAYGASVVTCLTAQNTTGVAEVHPVPPEFVIAQISAVAADLEVAAIKTGMLFDTATARAVAAGLKSFSTRAIVVDPVMVATSGDTLLSQAAIDVLRSEIIPHAAVITPNRAEAAALLDCKVALTVAEMTKQAHALMRFGCKSVLVTGGDELGDADAIAGQETIDVYVSGHGERVFPTPRIATKNTHGSGCTLSSAITAGLADGADMELAISNAKAFVHGALQAGSLQSIGQGAGPLDHAWDTHPPDSDQEPPQNS